MDTTLLKESFSPEVDLITTNSCVEAIDGLTLTSKQKVKILGGLTAVVLTALCIMNQGLNPHKVEAWGGATPNRTPTPTVTLTNEVPYRSLWPTRKPSNPFFLPTQTPWPYGWPQPTRPFIPTAPVTPLPTHKGPYYGGF